MKMMSLLASAGGGAKAALDSSVERANAALDINGGAKAALDCQWSGANVVQASGGLVS